MSSNCYYVARQLTYNVSGEDAWWLTPMAPLMSGLEMKVEAISHSIPEFVASVFAIVQVS